MRDNKKIFCAVTLIGLFIFNAGWAEESVRAPDRDRDRETINYITSVNIKMPKGAVYRRGESLPIVVEIQNKSSFSLPFHAINGLKRFRFTDGNGNIIGEGKLWNHISPWEYRDGFLGPTETISDTFYFERLHYRVRGNFPTQINIRFEMPVQDRGNNAKYTYGVPIELRDSPFEYTLVSDDLPQNWTDDMDIFWEAGGGIAFRYSAIHIEGSGRVTTIHKGIRDVNSPIKDGRNEFKCGPDELNRIAWQLRNFKIEKLNAYDSDKVFPDAVSVSITISKGGKIFCCNFPSANADVRQLGQIIMSLIDEEN